MLERLRDVVPLTDDDIARFNALRRSKHSYQGIPLRLKLSEDEIARFSVNRWAFPGVDVVPYLTRSYPLGDEFAHVVGYVGRIDENDARAARQGRVRRHDARRQDRHRALLRGPPARRARLRAGRGQRRQAADLRVARDASRRSPARICISRSTRVCRKSPKPRSTAAPARRSRSIRAMAKCWRWSACRASIRTCSSTASRARTTRRCSNDEDKPLLNRALARRLHAGLDDQAVHRARRARARPAQTRGHGALGRRVPSFPGQSRGYRDDKRGGHGRVDLVQAIAQSVNTYFYSLAYDMGIDRLSSGSWPSSVSASRPAST